MSIDNDPYRREIEGLFPKAASVVLDISGQLNVPQSLKGVPRFIASLVEDIAKTAQDNQQLLPNLNQRRISSWREVERRAARARVLRQ